VTDEDWDGTSDEQRAEERIASSGMVGIAKHVASEVFEFVGLLIFNLITTTLAVAAAFHFGTWWGALGAAYALLQLALSMRIGTLSVRSIRTKAPAETAEWARTRAAEPATAALRRKGFWLRLVTWRWPRALFAAYEISLWAPVPIAAGLGAVFLAVPIAAGLRPPRRLMRAADLLNAPRGPEGLPTPEI
jgi:hypothetical protein